MEQLRAVINKDVSLVHTSVMHMCTRFAVRKHLHHYDVVFGTTFAVRLVQTQLVAVSCNLQRAEKKRKRAEEIKEKVRTVCMRS